MKGLLHSKRFRKNLYKWLTAYVGVVLLLTMLVTYSKYMYSVGTNESAYTAVFNAEFIDLTCGNSGSLCKTKKYRPTSKIEYEFAFDTLNTEISTFLEIDVYIDPRFNIEGFYINGVSYDEVIGEVVTVDNALKKIRVEENILALYGKVNTYKVVISYPYENITEDTNLGSISDIVHVGYSAAQIGR